MSELFSFVVDQVIKISPAQLKKTKTINDFFYTYNGDVRQQYGVMPGKTFRAHFFLSTLTWVETQLILAINEILKNTPGEFEDWLTTEVFLTEIDLDEMKQKEPLKIYNGVYDHEIIGDCTKYLFPQELMHKLQRMDTRFLYKKGVQYTKKADVFTKY